MLDRTVAPPIVDAVNFNLKLQPYTRHVLKNGVEVFAIDAGTEEVMQLEWVFDAGNWMEEKNLQAAVANYLLKNGTHTRSAFQINEHFEYYGAYLNRNCYAETATLSLHCLSKHISELLPVVQDIVANSQLPAQEITLAVHNMKQKLEVNLKKSSFVAGRLIDVSLFGANHPYGRFSRKEDFDALTREDLLLFYETYYQRGSFKIFMAGRLPENIVELLEKYFGHFPNIKPSKKSFSIEPAAQKLQTVINDEKNNQGSIRLARPFFNRHHPDFLKCQVLNIVFGGYFGSRLMANIREEKGYTYGIHSYLLNHTFENAWMIATEAGREVSAATIEEVHKEMQLLREELIDEEELSLVKNFMMGSILGDLDGPFHIISRWKNIILNDLPPDFFDRSIENIKTISAEDLQEMAQKYLIPQDFHELIVV